MTEVELWGGHECTVNRVGSRYFDQTVRSGHHDRPGDLDLFAELGVKALRYPVVWERHAPTEAEAPDFTWSDARLRRLADLRVRPIIGLLHHGAGPAHTGLLDEAFPVKLAAYARRVADRYGEVRDWTPVNEPLTTARFSALYGHWHPHTQDERLFWAALLNQIDAIRLSMAAIRRANPKARLIQTEDVGTTYSTPELADQARFDNIRSLASFDLLFGRLTADHPLWRRLVDFGFERRLAAIAEDPCPPDVVGVNHYVTSDRLLDHRADAYPPARRGGNGREVFADVEAVRGLLPGPGGWAQALETVSARYGAPIAVTECHIGCSHEEQMRWFLEAWDAACALKDRGAVVEGVTAWSLLGAYDWQDLLTRDQGRYEPGVFDLSGGAPRPTAMAGLLKALAHGRPPPDAACGSGWWRRDVRFNGPPVLRSMVSPDPPRRLSSPRPARPLAIVGATGALGRGFARACRWRGLDYILLDRRQAPLEDADALARMLDAERPWAVINAAGYGNIEAAEAAPGRCFEINARGAARLGEACAKRGVLLAGFSSDLVFDGAAASPYIETGAPAPLNVLGASQQAGEAHLLACGALVIRTAALFSPLRQIGFAGELSAALRQGLRFDAASDLVVSPTYAPDLVEAVLDLVIDGAAGLWHLAGDRARTWSGFAADLAEALSGAPELVRPREAAAFGWTAQRPAYAALGSGRGIRLAPYEDAVDRYGWELRRAGFVAGRPVCETPRDRAEEGAREAFRLPTGAGRPRPGVHATT